MPLDWGPLVELVGRHRRIIMTTHIRPDGDGLGSMLAFDDALRQLGKETRLVISSPMTTRYQFLDPERRIERFSQAAPSPPAPLPQGARGNDAELAIVLDTGTWNQLGDFGPYLRGLPADKVVIDHHQTQDDLGARRFVDVGAEATGRLAYQAIRALGVPLSERAANALFVALAMDTGWFRHSNTQPTTFALAEELVASGARPQALYEHLFEQNTLPRLKLTGLILDRLTLTAENRVGYTDIRRSDYLTTGASPQDSEDLVNYTLSLAGVEIGLLFMEQPRGGVKVSFRARAHARVDVARLAERFGGGGHKLASGAVLDAPLDEARARVLEAVLAALPKSLSS